jgi:hypothetical protein
LLDFVKNIINVSAVVKIRLKTTAQSMDVDVCHAVAGLIDEGLYGHLILPKAVLVPSEWIGSIPSPFGCTKLHI